VSPRTWWLALYIVLGPTAVAYLLTYWALARVESSTVALFIYLQPVIATSFSVLFQGARPDAATLTGAGLIFGAVYLALRPPGRRPAPGVSG
jgi:drug/metabolite transporter (DMT)-like permease